MERFKIERYRGRVVFNKKLSEKVVHCRIEHIEPSSMQFHSGQFFVLMLDNGIKRSYSIGSSPNNTDYIETYVDITPGGPGSQFFINAKEGTEVGYVGPVGKFIYEENDNPAVFISTGTGITPHIAMVEYALESGTKRKLRILEGLRYKSEIFLEEKFQDWKEKNANFDYQFCLSKDELNGKTGRVTAFLNEVVSELGIDIDIYVCGAKYVIESVKEELAKLGVDVSKVRHEKYF
jgi:CDP-4-dehydro-6-deoxyglucose reductase